MALLLEVIQMREVNVISRYMDGRMIRGSTKNFSPYKDRFHILRADRPFEEPTEIALRDLKAVFIVRDLIGDPIHRGAKKYVRRNHNHGRKMEVTFYDGEVMVGSTLSYNSSRQGFFLFPADPDSNNLRVFVLFSAVKSIRYV